jgi:predicted nucleic acid-binding protein
MLRMPYVVVDTNALMRDYLLIEANMQTFLQGCQRCHIAVCLPEIVVDELCANYEKEINRQKSTLHTAARKLLAMGVKVETTDFDVKEASDPQIYLERTFLGARS